MFYRVSEKEVDFKKKNKSFQLIGIEFDKDGISLQEVIDEDKINKLKNEFKAIAIKSKPIEKKITEKDNKDGKKIFKTEK